MLYYIALFKLLVQHVCVGRSEALPLELSVFFTNSELACEVLCSICRMRESESVLSLALVDLCNLSKVCQRLAAWNLSVIGYCEVVQRWLHDWIAPTARSRTAIHGPSLLISDSFPPRLTEFNCYRTKLSFNLITLLLLKDANDLKEVLLEDEFIAFFPKSDSRDFDQFRWLFVLFRRRVCLTFSWCFVRFTLPHSLGRMAETANERAFHLEWIEAAEFIVANLPLQLRIFAVTVHIVAHHGLVSVPVPLTLSISHLSFGVC